MLYTIISTLSITNGFSKNALKQAYQGQGCCPTQQNVPYNPCAIIRVPEYDASGFTCAQAADLHCNHADSEGMIFPSCSELCYGVHTGNCHAPPALPSSVAAIVIGSTDHTILEEALIATGLVTALQGDGNFTVFAPTDNAFEQYMQDLGGLTKAEFLALPGLSIILKNHVLMSTVLSGDIADGNSVVFTLSGTQVSVEKTQVVTFGGAIVTTADMTAHNGVVHVIDKVVHPPQDWFETVLDIVGDWKLDPTSDAMEVPNWQGGMDSVNGALNVGEARGTGNWWATTNNDVTTRACIFDDIYRFNADGTFQNILGDQTYLEEWQQGVSADGCGAPVAPHDGSNSATYTLTQDIFDTSNEGKLRIYGRGAFMGIAKVHNTGEDGAPEKDTIEYILTSFADNKMVLDINYGSGWWQYNFIKVTR